MSRLLTVLIRDEQDVVTTRQRARELAGLLGFDHQDQIRIATAVSEIARNAQRYGAGGKAGFYVEDAPAALVASISDSGPGIRDVNAILEGRYRSSSGMGLGIVGAQRLVDGFSIESTPGKGTVVQLRKNLPASAPTLTSERLGRICDGLASSAQPGDLVTELQLQNQELLRSLEELRVREEELRRLSSELQETNRGVVALYAELDERAEHLRSADEAKSRFLSHVSHEFRTPLNSILALCTLLLSRADGPLTPEQEKQVGYLRRSAEQLYELVNDLLDLAKVEAGKSTVRVSEFEVASLFGTLRGMLKPLLGDDKVNLIFEEPRGVPVLRSDESKVAQILRNFISNALKFTEKGEVRVTAKLAEHEQAIVLAVADTGIGIPAEHQHAVFDEFTQIDNPLQRHTKGTGLGLALSKKLAELLGGTIRLESIPGAGSTFSLVLPLATVSGERSPGSKRVLVIDDEEVSRYLIRQTLTAARFEVQEAAGGMEGLRKAREQGHQAILLDLNMEGMNGFEVLRQLKADPATSPIPVVIVTSKALRNDEKEALERSASAVLSKEFLSRPDAATHIQAVLGNL